jgi:hypothetical protein
VQPGERLTFAIDNFFLDALMTFQSLVAKALVLGASLTSFAAYADVGGPPTLNTVPEPGVWALFGLAAAIGAIVSRKRK